MGADFIEKAAVLGWSVVIRKGEFKVNDLCVYVEIDSVLPEKPEFEALRATHFRVKTTKRKGCISQGICFSTAILPQSTLPEVGTDVSQVLGIVKYEPEIPANLRGEIKGAFPAFLRKTDEMRIQSVPEVLERHKGKLFYKSEKLDGSSVTYFLNNNEFGVCSRNLELKETEGNAYWKAARTLDIENKLRKLEGNWAIQGEIIGPGIQKNKYQLKEGQVKVFNIFNIDTYQFLDYAQLVETASHLGLETVPMLGTEVLEFTVDQLVEKSTSQSNLKPDLYMEGMVWRPVVEGRDEELGRLSFKCLNPKFLLKYEE